MTEGTLSTADLPFRTHSSPIFRVTPLTCRNGGLPIGGKRFLRHGRNLKIRRYVRVANDVFIWYLDREMHKDFQNRQRPALAHLENASAFGIPAASVQFSASSVICRSIRPAQSENMHWPSTNYAVFNSPEDVFHFLAALFGFGRVKRRETAERGIRRLQPSQGLPAVCEDLTCTH